MPTTPLRAAAVYVRISDDSLGLGLGVARQETDCRALADRLGLQVIQVYSDNDLSASTGRRRPQFEAMLRDCADGVVQVVVAYSTSRLTRRPAELERLVSLHESFGTTFATVASGSVDLATADGRLVARILASADAAEVERASERIRRKQAV